MVKLWVATGASPLVADTVTGPVPGAVAVPEISPVGLSASPGGRVPALSVNVAVGLSKVVVSWWL